jgi:hypothetical protein
VWECSAGRKGKQTAKEGMKERGHVQENERNVGSGVGAFFLLQDCSVLLVNGERCSYFPSFYVDEYGKYGIVKYKRQGWKFQ